jgi:hypothetical protein
MKDEHRKPMSFDARDEKVRPAPETVDFDRIVEASFSRRRFLGGVVAFGSGAAALGLGTLMQTTSAQAQTAAISRFGFTLIGIQTDFSVHVPEAILGSLSPAGAIRCSRMRRHSTPKPVSPLQVRNAPLAKTPTAWNSSTSTAIRSSR